MSALYCSYAGMKTDVIWLIPPYLAQKLYKCTTVSKSNKHSPYSSYINLSFSLGKEPYKPLISHSDDCQGAVASLLTNTMCSVELVGSVWHDLIKKGYLPRQKAESTTPFPPVSSCCSSSLSYTPLCSATWLSWTLPGLLIEPCYNLTIWSKHKYICNIRIMCPTIIETRLYPTISGLLQS